MKITITVEVEPEHADPGHATGVTEEAYERLVGLGGLTWLGEVVEVEKEKP